MIERFAVAARSPEWHALRARDLTASDAGAAEGLDPFKSPLMLWAEKSGLLLPVADTNLMRRGRWFESAVITAIREEHPDWDIQQPHVYLRDPEHRLGATPDAIAATDQPGLTNIQLKTVAKPEWLKRWQDGPPLHYVLQTLTEGLLLEADRSLLAALVIDTYSAELQLYEVPRHAAAEDRLKQVSIRFWADVTAGRRPAADWTRDGDALAQLFPQSVPEPALDLTGDNFLAAHLDERAQLKQAISEAETRVGEIDVEIRDKLGEAERAVIGDWKLSLKTQHRKAFTVPAKDFRVLRVSHHSETEEQAA